MRSLVMSDVETKSEWSHLLGRAMAGPLQGELLTPLVSDMLTWAAWRDQYPETTVLDMSPTARRYTAEIYQNADQYVYGFQLDGQSYMISIQRLMVKPLHNLRVGNEKVLVVFDTAGFATRLFDPRVGDRELTFVVLDEETMRDEQTGSTWNRRSGRALQGELSGSELQQLVGILSFRKAWENFHPASLELGF